MSGLKMLGLTARTLMVLERAGVTEVEQLCQMKSWRVFSIPGLGKVSYKEIASGMTAHGLHFEDSEPKDSPCTTPQASGIHSVTLRDYFAARVDVSDEVGVRYAEEIVGRAMPDFASAPLDNIAFWADYRAISRYIEADAMLAARVKP